MTEPAQSHPPRPTPGPAAPRAVDAEPAPVTSGVAPFGGLADRPVADHVAVYEAEHERLQRELSTIDQL